MLDTLTDLLACLPTSQPVMAATVADGSGQSNASSNPLRPLRAHVRYSVRR